MAFFKKMATVVHDYIESGNRLYTISSSEENIPGIYLMPQLGPNFGSSNHFEKSATALDDIILIAGGLQHHQTYSNKVETFNDFGPLRALADLPYKAVHGVGGLLSSHPIVCGGTSGDSEIMECFILSEDGSSWSYSSYLREARISSSAVVLSNVLWITGGYVPPFDALSTTEVIHVDGSNIIGPNLIEPLYGHCSLVADKNVFIIGGYNGTYWTNSTRIHSGNNLSFVELGPQLNIRRSLHGCCLVSSAKHEGRNVIVVAGGRNAPSSVEMLDYTVPDATWQKGKLCPLPKPH